MLNDRGRGTLFLPLNRFLGSFHDLLSLSRDSAFQPIDVRPDPDTRPLITTWLYTHCCVVEKNNSRRQIAARREQFSPDLITIDRCLWLVCENSFAAQANAAHLLEIL